MKILDFKTVSPLFEMERDGIKPFTERLFDNRDGRFRILSRWHGEPLCIRITNPTNGENFTRRLIDKRYMQRNKGMSLIWIKPSWLILYLGEKAEVSHE